MDIVADRLGNSVLVLDCPFLLPFAHNNYAPQSLRREAILHFGFPVQFPF